MKKLKVSLSVLVISILLGSCGGSIGGSSAVLPKLGIEASTGGEATGKIDFAVSLDKASSKAVTFEYKTKNGSADESDFIAIELSSLEIPAGETSIVISVIVSGDDEKEPNETFILALSNPSNAEFADKIELITAVGTIIDDDTIVVTVTEVITSGGGESASNITYNLSINQVLAKDLTLAYEVTSRTATSDDFSGGVLPSGNVTIPAGSDSATIEIGIFDDALIEGAETFNLVLTGLPSGVVFEGTASDLQSIVAIIVDNDLPPVVEERVSTLIVTEVAGGSEFNGSVFFDVLVLPAKDDSFSFNYRVTPVTADEDDFPAGTLPAGTATVPGNSSGAAIQINLFDDSLYEETETFNLVLDGLPADVIFEGKEASLTVIGSIQDNDTSFVDVELKSGREGNGSSSRVLFEVSIVPAKKEEFSFSYQVDGLTADAKDFPNNTLPSGTVTIPANSGTAKINLPVLDDSLPESEEIFNLVLSGLPVGVEFVGRTGERKTVVGLIKDDDTATLRVEFEGGESDGIIFAINIFPTLNRAVTFDYSVALDDSATLKAANENDFPNSILPSGTITIPADTSNVSLEVPVFNDDLAEGPEEFHLVLAGLPADLRFNGTEEDSLTVDAIILDNDFGIYATFQTGSETDGIVFEVSVLPALSEDLAFNYAVTEQVADASDFPNNVLPSGIINVPAHTNKFTVRIPVFDDDLLEGTERFQIVLSDLPNNSSFANRKDNFVFSGTITDDDYPSDSNGNGLIEISSYTEMSNMRYNLAGTGYKTSHDDNRISCPRLTPCRGYELVTDITLPSIIGGDPYNWLPIGSLSAPFTAEFNGNDHTLSNLHIYSGSSLIGFFGISSGIIKDLTFDGGSITSLYLGSEYYPSNVGSVVGLLQAGGELYNVSSNLSISKDYGGYNRVGGIVGVSRGTIQASSASGNIRVISGDNNSLGGLVGVSAGTIQASSASGNITSNDGDNNRLGGLVGVSAGNIRDSFATGNSDSRLQSDLVKEKFTYVGGLVGENYSKIIDSYAIGNTYAGNSDSDAVGGLAGFSSGGIRGSYAIGKAYGGNGNSDKVGGLVGVSSGGGFIQGSYASGNTSGGNGNSDTVGGLVGISSGGVLNSYASGTASGGGGDYDNVGGLVGRNGNNIQSSYAIGIVNGNAGKDYTGGLVGNNRAPIKNSYATGAVNGGAGNDYVGGIAGVNLSSVANSYATGTLRGNSGYDKVGGLVGENYSVVKHSYAISDIYGDDSWREVRFPLVDHIDWLVGSVGNGSWHKENYYNKSTILHYGEWSNVGAGTGIDNLTTITSLRGFTEDNWSFSAAKYPSLKDGGGNLLCNQPDGWAQCQ